MTTPLRLPARLGLLAAVLSLPAAAAAQEPPAEVVEPTGDRGLKGLSVSLDTYGMSRLDDARGLWDGREWGATGLEVAYDLWRLTGDVRLSLGVGWMSEDQQTESALVPYYPGQRYDSPLNGGLERDSLQVTATLRWRTGHTLQPYLGLAAGGTRARLRLDHLAVQPTDATAHGLLGRASLGIRLHPRALTFRRNGRTVLGLALGCEAGALTGTPLRFSLQPRVDGQLNRAETTPIAVHPVPLGALGQTGAYGRLALIVIF